MAQIGLTGAGQKPARSPDSVRAIAPCQSRCSVCRQPFHTSPWPQDPLFSSRRTRRVLGALPGWVLVLRQVGKWAMSGRGGLAKVTGVGAGRCGRR
jgi:hypothetical protein